MYEYLIVLYLRKSSEVYKVSVKLRIEDIISEGMFAENQYGMYSLIHERDGLHRLFEACYRDNLHSIWAGQELYRPGNTREEFYNILQKNICCPVGARVLKSSGFRKSEI